MMVCARCSRAAADAADVGGRFATYRRWNHYVREQLPRLRAGFLYSFRTIRPGDRSDRAGVHAHIFRRILRQMHAKTLVVNLLLGWWSVVSLLVIPVFLIRNRKCYPR